MKTAAQALRQAPQELRSRGWYQGNYEDPATGAVCASGALRYALAGRLTIRSNREQAEYAKAIMALARAMREQFNLAAADGGVGSINDTLVTDVQQVIFCMEKAAIALEGEIT